MSDCDNCGKVLEKELYCGRCKEAVYCSRECQGVAWAEHKKVCREEGGAPAKAAPTKAAPSKASSAKSAPTKPTARVVQEHAGFRNRKKGRRDAPGGKPKKESAAEKKAREEKEEEEWENEMEDKLEKYCGRACTIWFMLAPLLSVINTVGEFALRPEMPVLNTPLHGQYAVITGGCGAIGSQAAQMMAEGGANVVIGCRNQTLAEEVRKRIEISVAEKAGYAGAAIAEEDDDEVVEGDFGEVSKGTIRAWRLDLESFQSVKEFATKYEKEIGEKHGLQTLVLNAGTTDACTYTKDQREQAFQVNYLSHFLLTNLLAKNLQKGGSAQVLYY
jgi:NADP-dependent 3-hydroxy acid dehydrogenase YdfG